MLRGPRSSAIARAYVTAPDPSPPAAASRSPAREEDVICGDTRPLELRLRTGPSWSHAHGCGDLRRPRAGARDRPAGGRGHVTVGGSEGEETTPGTRPSCCATGTCAPSCGTGRWGGRG